MDDSLLTYILNTTYTFLLLLATYVYLSFAARNSPTIRKNGGIVTVALLAWLLYFSIFINFRDSFPASDAGYHQEQAEAISEYISYGHYSFITSYLRPGNQCFEFFCGIFMAVMRADTWVFQLAGYLYGFTGLCHLITLMDRQSGGQSQSRFLTFFILFLPSFIFWTPDLLKEGFCLGCNARIATLLFSSSTNDFAIQSREKLSAFIALIGLVLLRPHFALAWFAGLSIGPAIANGKYGKAVVFSSFGVVGLAMLAVCIPEIFDKFAEDGVTSTLQGEYSARADLGGSSLGRGNPIPVITGASLILFRPFPWEVSGAVGLFVSAESLLTGMLLVYGMFHIRYSKRILKDPVLMGGIIVALVYFAEFSYMYNFGLMIRQRICVYPALFLIAFPYYTIARSLKAKVLTQHFRHSSFATHQRAA